MDILLAVIAVNPHILMAMVLAIMAFLCYQRRHNPLCKFGMYFAAIVAAMKLHLALHLWFYGLG